MTKAAGLVDSACWKVVLVLDNSAGPGHHKKLLPSAGVYAVIRSKLQNKCMDATRAVLLGVLMHFTPAEAFTMEERRYV
ncbi:MAG: hypothetical protein ACLP0A_06745 [Verrucomicrobiia bacterium]